MRVSSDLLAVRARPVRIILLLGGHHQPARLDIGVGEREVPARALEEARPSGEVRPDAAALQQGDCTLDALADGGNHLRVRREPARRRRVELDTLDRVRDAAARGGQLEVRGGLEVLLVEVVVEVTRPAHDGDDGRVGLSHAAELEEVLREG